MADITADINRLHEITASWRDAVLSTEAEGTAQLLGDPSVKAGVEMLTAALAAQRALVDLLEVEALDRFHANKQLEGLAANSLKEAGAVVRRAQDALAKAVRAARSERDKAAVASTVSRVTSLLGKAPQADAGE